MRCTRAPSKKKKKKKKIRQVEKEYEKSKCERDTIDVCFGIYIIYLYVYMRKGGWGGGGHLGSCVYHWRAYNAGSYLYRMYRVSNKSITGCPLGARRVQTDEGSPPRLSTSTLLTLSPFSFPLSLSLTLFMYMYKQDSPTIHTWAGVSFACWSNNHTATSGILHSYNISPVDRKVTRVPRDPNTHTNINIYAYIHSHPSIHIYIHTHVICDIIDYYIYSHIFFRFYKSRGIERNAHSPHSLISFHFFFLQYYFSIRWGGFLFLYCNYYLFYSLYY